MEFALKMMEFVLKRMEIDLKMMEFVLTMMNFQVRGPHFPPSADAGRRRAGSRSVAVRGQADPAELAAA